MDEDKKKLSEGEKLLAMTQSDGWAILEARYKRIVSTLADLRTIKETASEQRFEEMQKREAALSLFQELYKGVMGEVEDFQDQMEGLGEVEEEDNYIRIDA